MQTSKEIVLPIGLPSLKIAWLQCPHPMSEADFNQIIATIAMCRDALTAQAALGESP